MKKYLALILLIGILTGMAACAAAPAPRAARNLETAPAAAPAAPAADQARGGAANQSGVPAVASNAAGVPNDTDRMIVKNVDMSLIVADAVSAMEAVSRLASDAGGYVADSKSWRDGEQLRATMTVRIPANGLDGALVSLRKLAVRVDQENITGQDVTEEYTDLNAQLTNLEATETELRALMTDMREKTQKAEDILAIYRELTTIRGEIERVKGRIQYLSNVTSMATIKLDLTPDVLAQPVAEPGWRPLETLKTASRASVNMLRGAVDALIWLAVYGVPLLLIIGVPIALVVFGIRWLVRRGRRSTPRKDLTAGAAQ